MRPSQEELDALNKSISDVNNQIIDLYEKYGDHIRIFTRAGYNMGEHANVSVELTEIIANLRG